MENSPTGYNRCAAALLHGAWPLIYLYRDSFLRLAATSGSHRSPFSSSFSLSYSNSFREGSRQAHECELAHRNVGCVVSSRVWAQHEFSCFRSEAAVHFTSAAHLSGRTSNHKLPRHKRKPTTEGLLPGQNVKCTQGACYLLFLTSRLAHSSAG